MLSSIGARFSRLDFARAHKGGRPISSAVGKLKALKALITPHIENKKTGTGRRFEDTGGSVTA